ncbi:uncharacterized protein LOC132203890 [Neocloeon triangulifer]|uniref:uncharacterized protein LOC132203890 n=1 Tax=Neocloeon triangulifer TaxID=2078957 RepID=UPI00286F09CD|nr:uncharacterized protein LOC132203890 [Neocloeon triangulifer]XP_059488032.1 uncharacterized protein LOC132203890 [Neocloeon triangulifer]
MVYTEKKRKIFCLAAGKGLVVAQRFMTRSEDDAKAVSIMEKIQTGSMSEESWRVNVHDVLNKRFDQQGLLETFELNQIFETVHDEFEEPLRRVLLCCLVARTELLCQACGVKKRTKLHDCQHDSGCYDCMKANQENCLVMGCGGNLSGGHTVSKHKIA